MNRFFITLIVAAICLVASCIAQPKVTAFSADLFVHNDPSMNKGSGVTINKLYYDYGNKKLRLDYPKLKDPKKPGSTDGVKEIYDYGARTFAQLCKDCSLYRYSLSQPEYFKNDGDKEVKGNTYKHPVYGICQAWQKQNPITAGQVSIVYVSSAGFPCRVQRADKTLIDFSNVKVGAQDPNLFVLPKSAKCPTQPTCAAPIDLVLVFDQSGSIKPPEWKQLLAFGNAIIDGFEIGPQKTQIGLVFFSGVDYKNGENPASCCGLSAPVLPLSFEKGTIKKFLNNHKQTGGHTCINCGINSATTYEPNPNRAIQAPKIMIVLTDGFNNRMVNFFGIDIANAKSQGWRMFAVGVRRSDPQELQLIASNPVKDHFFYVDDFSLLKTIQNTIIERVCGEFPDLSPCGPLCKGKCTCGGQCLCPDTCSTNGDKCASGECIFNEAGSGCRIVRKVCPPSDVKDKCKSNVCNPVTGQCEVKTKTCTGADKCVTATCDPKVGCVYKDKCAAKLLIPGTQDTSLCLKRICSPEGICSSSAVKCTASSKCVKSVCDPKLGCVETPINCNDGNRCTINTCDPKVGCKVEKTVQCPPAGFYESKEYLDNKAKYACVTFRCDPNVGCTTTPKICNDNNKCTTDKCDPATGKCVYSAVVCVTDPTNKCVNVKCDSLLGCQTTTKNCDDGNPCTTDSCDPATGECKNTAITCPPPSTPCVSSKCDAKAGKCVEVPNLLCDQGSDKCKQAKCNPQNQQCQEFAVSCIAKDKCGTAVCDSKAGCVTTPITCDDKNPCTTDKCDPAKGCVFEPIVPCTSQTCPPDCVTTDPCNPKVCTKDGCITRPVVCDKTDKCTTFKPTVVGQQCQCKVVTTKTCPNPTGSDCGEGVCDPSTGECVVKSDRICDNKDPCVTAQCKIVDGNKQCVFTSIKCPGDSPCSRKKCINENGKAKCVDDPLNGIKCDNTTECATGTCDTTTGKCVYTEKKCDTTPDLCVARKCDAATGKCVSSQGLDCPANDLLGCGKSGICKTIDEKPTCVFTPSCPRSTSSCLFANCTQGNCKSFSVNCDDGDPCTTVDKCIPLGYDESGKPLTKCEYTPFTCPASKDPCKVNKCVNQNGKAKCVETDVVCDDGSKCTTGKCVEGKCVFTELECGKADVCAFYSCDPVNGCIKKNRCNDSNPCTQDICDPKTGACSFVPLDCNSTDPCKVGKCDEAAGCVLVPLDCTQNATFNATIDACHFGACDPVKGCVLNVVPNTLNSCGKCGGEDTCRNANATGIPVAATAGAVVGAAVVVGAAAIGLGVLLAKKAADSYTPGNDDAIVGGNTNPLYEQPADEGTNPFHNEVGSGQDYVPLN